jgi:hypothetical protein
MKTTTQAMKPLTELQAGDTVYLDCPSSLGASSTGTKTIQDIQFKYDEDTGDKYRVIVLGSGDKYDSRNGGRMPRTGGGFFYITSNTPEDDSSNEVIMYTEGQLAEAAMYFAYTTHPWTMDEILKWIRENKEL